LTNSDPKGGFEAADVSLENAACREALEEGQRLFIPGLSPLTKFSH
jgi:hypothetical protein